MAVPTPGRATVRHAARSAAKKGTTLIRATNGMHGAFKASYFLNGPEPSDWYVDTGASAHMTPDLSHLDQARNYTGKERNRQTGRVVATGKRDGGLYVLEHGNSAFIYVLKNKALHASYDLWHACLGHHTSSIACPHRFSEVFTVLIPLPLSFISPTMLNLMNTTCLPKMAPRPNPSLSPFFKFP
ncbi:hypothetical protein AAG906_039235 [Vitis piasezkii]